MLRLFYIFIIVVIGISCTPVVEREYYEGTGAINIIKEERRYSSKDKGDYDYTLYYSNGQVCSAGPVKNSKEEGIWEYWYEDGTKKCSVPYINGKIDYGSKQREAPYLIFSDDSLKIGVPTTLKVIGLYPGEGIFTSLNVDLISNEDESMVVIPREGADQVKFGYHKLQEVGTNKECSNLLRTILEISEEELKYSSLYKTSIEEIQTIPIYNK